jgi:Kdo2-lipid IVA lauroyltransferase/acyltransferase
VVDVELHALPAKLRQDWPVERLPVVGTRDGLLARIEFLAARGALWTLGSLPDVPRELALGAFARLAKTFDRSHSNAARAFLRQALGEMPAPELEARVLEAWRHFLRIIVESENFERRVDLTRLLDHYTFDLSDEVRELFASKQGRIVVTSHLGDWEAGSAALPWIGCDPLYAVVKPPNNRPMSIHAQKVREGRGIRLLPRRGAMQHAGAILRAGGTLAMVLDQRARTRPVMAPFFGRVARCDRSAGVLLRRLRAPVVLGACYREGPWRWHVVLRDVIHPRDIAGLDPAAIATRINQGFERDILARPEQYFWLHDRYRDTEAADVAAPETDEE